MRLIEKKGDNKIKFQIGIIGFGKNANRYHLLYQGLEEEMPKIIKI